MKSIFFIFCMIVLAGCSSVTMKEPFPESQLTQEEQAQLTGSWETDGEVIHIAFTSNSVPWLAGVDWENEDFQLEKYRLYFVKRNNALYVCMQDETNEYLFAELKVENNNAFLWGPDTDYFEKLVESGKLKGSAKEDKYSATITLETAAADILELISTNQAAIDYKNPLLYRKLD